MLVGNQWVELLHQFRIRSVTHGLDTLGCSTPVRWVGLPYTHTHTNTHTHTHTHTHAHTHTGVKYPVIRSKVC